MPHTEFPVAIAALEAPRRATLPLTRNPLPHVWRAGKNARWVIFLG